MLRDGRGRERLVAVTNRWKNRRIETPPSLLVLVRKRTIQFYLFVASIFSPELVECETLKTETSNVRSVVATDPKNGCSRKRPVRHRVVHQRRLSLSLSLEGEPRFSKGARFSGKDESRRASGDHGEGRNGKFKFRDGLNGANVSTRSSPVHGRERERGGAEKAEDDGSGRPII